MSTPLEPRAGARPRVLLVAEAVTLSHVVRPDFFARGLHASGYDVVLACDSRYDHLFEPRPFPVMRLRSSIASPSDPSAARSGVSPLFDHATLERYLREDERLIRAVLPDVVVGDMRHSLPLAARKQGIRSISILDAAFSPFAAIGLEVSPPPYLPPVGAGLGAAIYNAIQPLGHLIHTLPTNELMQAHGQDVRYRTVQEVFAAGDYVVHPDFPELVPMKERRSSHRFVGPVRWSAKANLPFWWDSLPRDRPVVFLNISSSSPSGLPGLVLRALASMPVTVVAIADPRRVVHAAGPNAFLAETLPGEVAAARADLTISNGGNTSAQQSLAVGTPVLALPTYPEQLMFSRCLEGAGAGLRIVPGDQTEAAIAAAVAKMLANASYATAARRFAEEAERLDAQVLFNAVVGEALADQGQRWRHARF
ncbi:glycosyltransferase [Chelatococcus reniformis]|uniref:PGL/p-HBAD biosynthesis glycosyltransferase n=1 Tax=Chelatococcus reniformis TaxID=1494448 RepID=A0A916TX78_9HYPH|nr:nucleotide disphospho-sugar-binding domain-containing protein [Chelatococcus reniformis]GGC48621.1 PGL/p-HBAD biosynthesis glycosyltransferase [Chelatococcus reniformis]